MSLVFRDGKSKLMEASQELPAPVAAARRRGPPTLDSETDAPKLLELRDGILEEPIRMGRHFHPPLTVEHHLALPGFPRPARPALPVKRTEPSEEPA